MNSKRFTKLGTGMATALIALFSTNSNACPCGCGAVNPQVMYPGEDFKFYGSVTQDSQFETVRKDGTTGESGGPHATETYTLSLAKALSGNTSFSFALPIKRNTHDDSDSNSAMSDPSLSIRHTAYQQTFVSPLIPQVQFFSSYKHPVARSIYDGSEEENQMDIHGNGFSEFVPGIDLWFGMTDYKLGLAQVLIYPFERKFQNEDFEIDIEPGLGEKTSLTLGYALQGTGQALMTIDRETRRELKVNRVEIADSDVAVNSASLTTSLRVGPRMTAGLGIKKTAALGQNKNTTRGTGVTVSYIQAF